MRSETVLVVDEDAVALQHCCSVLAGAGYQVLWASSTQQAFDIWSCRGEIDLAVVSAVTPGMSGLELIQARQKPHARTLMSGRGPEEVKDLVANGGADYHVFWKPFDVAIFLQIISNLLAKPRGVASSQAAAA